MYHVKISLSRMGSGSRHFFFFVVVVFWPEYRLSPEANLLDIHYPVFLSALITRTQADERSDVPPGVCCG